MVYVPGELSDIIRRHSVHPVPTEIQGLRHLYKYVKALYMESREILSQKDFEVIRTVTDEKILKFLDGLGMFEVYNERQIKSVLFANNVPLLKMYCNNGVTIEYLNGIFKKNVFDELKITRYCHGGRYNPSYELLEFLVELSGHPDVIRRSGNVHHYISEACIRGDVRLLKLAHVTIDDLRIWDYSPPRTAWAFDNMNIIKEFIRMGLPISDFIGKFVEDTEKSRIEMEKKVDIYNKKRTFLEMVMSMD